MKRIIASLLCISLLSGCAFSRMTAINSTPAGAKLKVSGEARGETPAVTQIGCKTIGKKKEIELSKDGYRTLSTELKYAARGRNIFWSIFFAPAGLVFLFFVAECPRKEYHFDLAPESVSLEGRSTLKIVALSSEFDIYVGDQQVLPGQRMVFSPGWQDVRAEIEGQAHDFGEVWMEANTDYVLSLDVGLVKDRETQ